MKRGLLVILGLLLISGLVLGACAKEEVVTTTSTTIATATSTTTATSTKTMTSTTTASPTAQKYGGVLKIASFVGWKNLGYPGILAVGDHMYARPAIECLVAYDTENTEIIPWLATGWQYSPDYKSLTFNLRKGVKFHDDTDFNAEAVKFTLDMVREGVQPELKSVTSIDIVDNYTIRLNLSEYEPTFINNFMSWPIGGIVSMNAIKTMGEECKDHPVGTGPFKFVSQKRDVNLIYERFDGYWGGKPYLDGIEWICIADPTVSLLSLKSGEVQATRRIETKDVTNLQAAGFNVESYPSANYCAAGDSAHPDSPFNDIKVRQAITYAIDNKAICDTLGFGLYYAPNQCATPRNLGYNPNVVGYPYDPQKAMTLLAEAGYSTGFPTTVTFESFTRNTEMATMMQNHLQKVGIDLTLDAADRARSMQIIQEGWNNQMVLTRVNNDLKADPVKSLTNDLSSKSVTLDTKSLFLPADYETKLDLARVETDPQKRKAMIQELHKILIDDYCAVTPMLVSASIMASGPEVHEFDLYGDWKPDRTWLSK